MNKLEPFGDAVIHAYKVEGCGLKSIAKVYGCSVGTVRNFLIGRGIERRARGTRTQGKEPQVVIQVQTAAAAE